MKFYNWLNELFDTDVEIEKSESLDFCTYTFKVDEKWYQMEMTKDYDHWSLLFMDQLGRISITGDTGIQAAKVFSGVVKSVKMFVRNMNPKILYFTAKESSRKKLYDKFAEMIEKQTKMKQVKHDVLIKSFTEKMNIKEKLYLFWAK